MGQGGVRVSVTAWAGADPTQSADSGHYELGVEYVANVDILIDSIRVWEGATPGTLAGRQGRIWSTAGVVLATANMPDDLPSGWSVWDLAAQLAVPAGTRFKVSYTTGGFYGELNNAVDSAVVSGDGAVTALAAADAEHGNGSFTTSVTAFPDVASGSHTFYGIDFVYELPPSTAPSIDSVTTTVAAGGVATAVITASGDLTGVTYQWDWGDGHTSTSLTSSDQHPYTVSGTYSILASVETAGGQAFAASTARVLVESDSTIQNRVAELRDALSTIVGLSIYTEPDKNPNVPALYIGPPQLTWSVYNRARPDQMSFSLWLVVAANGYSVAVLEPLLDAISDALASQPDAVLMQAVPSSWPAGGSNIPAYLLTLEAGT